jgi:hypothetical protein
VSAALAAHGLHYALVGTALVLVVALLRSGRTRRSRSGREHERRVAELREAVRSGGLGAAPPEDEDRDRGASS